MGANVTIMLISKHRVVNLKDPGACGNLLSTSLIAIVSIVSVSCG
jgi:hypothetical protein